MPSILPNIQPLHSEITLDFVQYNALLTNGTVPGTNIYGGSWIGPPGIKLDPTNQTYASVVLVQGITLGNGTKVVTSPKPSNPTTPTLTPSPTFKSTSGGVIAGGVIGGLVGLGIVLTAVILQRRRMNVSGKYIVSPFTSALQGSETVMDTPTPIRIHTKPPPPGITARMAALARQEHSPLFPSSSDPRSETIDLHTKFHAMSTAEMFRILNARLQTESQHEEPPPYLQSQNGSAM
ncbi:hypothetical protein L218DRAFT_1007689 [Marasmius fiardii PR-910]|nr:hypothetical protein L218DRAFT_1007689 [Marasmius fiardii PR-910]